MLNRKIGQRILVGLGLLLLAALLTGCQLTQSGFERVAQKDGGTLAAAATTLDYFHHQKLSRAYTQTSFAGFENQLEGMEQELTSQDGAPPPDKLKPLLALALTALQAVHQPCLEENCDWSSQIAALQQAAKALNEAGQ
jgi:hypothetical protein